LKLMHRIVKGHIRKVLEEDQSCKEQTADRTSSRITAIKTINDMQGHTGPTKHKHVFANPDGTPLRYNVVTNYVAPGDLDK
jgi:hypothetical protein